MLEKSSENEATKRSPGGPEAPQNREKNDQIRGLILAWVPWGVLGGSGSHFLLILIDFGVVLGCFLELLHVFF